MNIQTKSQAERMQVSDKNEPRYWFIQKPIAHNVPLRTSGAVFQTFIPTVAEQHCEWVKVYDADDYEQLKKERAEYKACYDSAFERLKMMSVRLGEVEAELDALRISLKETKELEKSQIFIPYRENK